jgi:hypothetical protein
MAINSNQFKQAAVLSFVGRNKTTGKVFSDGVIADTGVLYSLKDAAQADVFGKRICASLVQPHSGNMPAHIEFIRANG